MHNYKNTHPQNSNLNTKELENYTQIPPQIDSNENDKNTQRQEENNQKHSFIKRYWWVFILFGLIIPIAVMGASKSYPNSKAKADSSKTGTSQISQIDTVKTKKETTLKDRLNSFFETYQESSTEKASKFVLACNEAYKKVNNDKVDEIESQFKERSSGSTNIYKDYCSSFDTIENKTLDKIRVDSVHLKNKTEDNKANSLKNDREYVEFFGFYNKEGVEEESFSGKVILQEFPEKSNNYYIVTDSNQQNPVLLGSEESKHSNGLEFGVICRSQNLPRLKYISDNKFGCTDTDSKKSLSSTTSSSKSSTDSTSSSESSSSDKVVENSWCVSKKYKNIDSDSKQKSPLEHKSEEGCEEDSLFDVKDKISLVNINRVNSERIAKTTGNLDEPLICVSQRWWLYSSQRSATKPISWNEMLQYKSLDGKTCKDPNIDPAPVVVSK
jgi:hypothetical protein